MRVSFNDEWLQKATLKQIRSVYKGDKIMTNLVLERKKQLKK
jgi:hypothetical protein